MQTNSHISKEKFRELFGQKLGESASTWLYPTLTLTMAVIPLAYMYAQSRQVTKLSLIRLPKRENHRKVLRVRTPNHEMRIPIWGVKPYPSPRNIDPSKCSLRWSFRGEYGSHIFKLNARHRRRRAHAQDPRHLDHSELHHVLYTLG